MSEPIRFIFGMHVHQPVGNFDHVFAEHVKDAYLPFLSRLAEADCLPIALHVSGPLLDWLESHHGAYLDLIGRLAAAGKLELLGSGYYEPVLAALPRADRREQIAWMRDALHRRFGVEATGLWLTERVWEPDLAGDLADAGVSYALVDDRHFLMTGLLRDRLHAPWRTEFDGRTMALLPIDERLRYLVPFKPPSETADYLRGLRAAGHRLAILADDGEKFGGWPGTREWVFDKGWLSEFLRTMAELREAGEVRLVTPAQALAEVPSAGLAYLPSASYREMEQWALPPEASLRLARLESDLGPARVASADGALVRGTHWRNFLVKYPEANRMHKKMLALSTLCRREGDPPAARQAIARAQCNDAYWHGVFGGLYLPHLRQAIWKNLAQAEAELRAGELLEVEEVDLDADGHLELWVHSASFSARVSPRRGGAIEEYARFADGINYADTLTRRREAYHQLTPARGHEGGEGTASIQEIEQLLLRERLPPIDAEDRALLVERLLPGDLGEEAFAAGDYQALRSWARVEMTAGVGGRGSAARDEVEIELRADGLVKRLRFSVEGTLTVAYQWDATGHPPGAYFSTELSLSARLPVTSAPAATEWWYPIKTVAKSERGLDETVQGMAVVLRWPASLGVAKLTLG